MKRRASITSDNPIRAVSRPLHQISATSFADENKDASRQCYQIDEENGWPKRQAEAEKAVEDQVDREQNHADAFVEFHDVDLADYFLS
jgi:hypothetical protein